MEHALFHDPVGTILNALAALVTYDVLLVRQAGLVQAVGEVHHPHAIRFQPERKFQLIRGKVSKQLVRSKSVVPLMLGCARRLQGTGNARFLEHAF